MKSVAVGKKFRSRVLLRFRAEFKMSQPKAAELIGEPFHLWTVLERYEFHNVGWSTISRVAQKLDVSPYDICPRRFLKENATLQRSRRYVLAAESRVAERATDRLTLPSPADAAWAALFRDDIAAALADLTFREREIIKLRYGFDDDSEGYTYTLEEVARIFKVTRERVRQVEWTALKKLRRPRYHLADCA